MLRISDNSAISTNSSKSSNRSNVDSAYSEGNRSHKSSSSSSSSIISSLKSPFKSKKSNKNSPMTPNMNYSNINNVAPPTSAKLPPRKVIKAISNYNSRYSKELSFKEGDFFFVTKEIENYYVVCNPLEKITGLVPKNYFSEVEKKRSAINKNLRSPNPNSPNSPSPSSPTSPNNYNPNFHNPSRRIPINRNPNPNYRNPIPNSPNNQSIRIPNSPNSQNIRIPNCRSPVSISPSNSVNSRPMHNGSFSSNHSYPENTVRPRNDNYPRPKPRPIITNKGSMPSPSQTNKYPNEAYSASPNNSVSPTTNFSPYSNSHLNNSYSSSRSNTINSNNSNNNNYYSREARYENDNKNSNSSSHAYSEEESEYDSELEKQIKSLDIKTAEMENLNNSFTSNNSNSKKYSISSSSDIVDDYYALASDSKQEKKVIGLSERVITAIIRSHKTITQDDGRTDVEYQMEIFKGDGQCYILYRTYSDFEHLICTLIDQFPEKAGIVEGCPRVLPFLLPKKYINENILDTFLQYLVQQSQEVQASNVFMDFFDSCYNDKDYIMEESKNNFDFFFDSKDDDTSLSPSAYDLEKDSIKIKLILDREIFVINVDQSTNYETLMKKVDNCIMNSGLNEIVRKLSYINELGDNTKLYGDEDTKMFLKLASPKVILNINRDD